jgi:hypothetical protein
LILDQPVTPLPDRGDGTLPATPARLSPIAAAVVTVIGDRPGESSGMTGRERILGGSTEVCRLLQEGGGPSILLDFIRRDDMAWRTQRRRARAPQTEPLEYRCLLAGNVLVAVNGGELDVTGDGAGNGVQITVASGHQFAVRGIADNGPTTINGKPLVNVDGVKGDVTVALGGGDDILSVLGTTRALALPKGLRVSVGSGDDLVALTNVTVKGNLEIRSGSDGDGSANGRDTVALQDVDVGGDARLQTGAGKDSVTIADSGFGGKLEVGLGAGDDSLSIANSEVLGDFEVDGGDGFDAFSDESNTFAGKIEVKDVESMSRAAARPALR